VKATGNLGLAFTIALACAAAASAETARLTKDRYVDKCKGAWAGQMIGVCYGAPYEFRSNGRPITGPLRPWTPDRIAGAIGQDDVYVEMTFLEALEDHGLDVTFEQAGQAFAATKFPLWHANCQGRINVRRGIMPPRSGHPDHNRHADDIDFQIEADLFGILCPGLPRESNRLCDVFGHVMNYGDGVYGGMFVAGMYAAAYFENENVAEVLAAGLACIPEASTYHQCISDVVRWHAEHPDDWLATWRLVEDTWQDDVDCMPGNPFNIDAKLNGAYIAMGLLYGDGDLLRTLEIATRCGQDADCNPSNAAGVVGCMKGFSALGAEWTSGIADIEDRNFLHTDYCFRTLVAACQRTTEAIILRAGGEVGEDAYVIPRQAPAPPPLEQWTDQMAILSVPISRHEVAAWDAAWEVRACGSDMSPGLREEQYGRKGVLLIHPVDRDSPAVLAAELSVPDTPHPTLALEVASDRRGDFLLKVYVQDDLVEETVVDTHGKWTTIEIDMTPYAGKTVPVRIENHADDWAWEAAYLDRVGLK